MFSNPQKEEMCMSESICNFIPAKDYSGNLKTVHFVYESDFLTLKQPFIRPIYYVHLVTSGSGKLRIYDREYPLEYGTVFFSFPAVPYTVEADENFKYMYVSFMGACVPALLENFGISMKAPVYPDFSQMIDFWMSSITRINAKNANILSESVLLYMLSFMGDKGEAKQIPVSDNFFEMLIDYVDTHYRDPDICLKKIAMIFSYTEKYISHLFKTKMDIGFNKYLNNLRIQYAHEIISKNTTSVSEIAALCGFSDPLYFSKVFKKRVGCSPTEYIKNKS